MNITIVPYQDRYRDDLIFMVLSAKDALGKVPTINPDLLDIPTNYFSRGDMFWLAIDENDRVVGSIGYSAIENTSEVFLHRLYVKPNLKRKGIGSKLLVYAENHIKNQGKTAIKVHLGINYYESFSFYPKHGYVEYQPYYMVKYL